MPVKRNNLDLTPEHLLSPIGDYTKPPNLLIGIDWGEKNIGIAIANTLTGLARPLTIINHKSFEYLRQKFASLITSWSPSLFIVGMPFKKDGGVQPICLRVREFAVWLYEEFGTPVSFVSEVFSTSEAKIDYFENCYNGQSKNRKNRKLDDYAASKILEYWLSENRQQNN